MLVVIGGRGGGGDVAVCHLKKHYREYASTPLINICYLHFLLTLFKPTLIVA